MSGGKGGSQTTQVEIPEWLSSAAQANLAQGRDVSQIGYTPYYGPDVAALTPTQQATRANIGQFAQAFGMQGIPDMALGTPTTYAGGIQGYSSGDLYDQAVQELAARRPGQYSKMMENFVDPYNPGGFQDRYANYFNQPTVTGGVNTTTNSSGLPGGEYYNVNPTTQTGPTAANIEFNGQLYNVADPQGLAAYNAARAAFEASNVPNNFGDQGNQGNQGNQGENAVQQTTAESAVEALRAAPDWKSLSAQQKIQRVVDMANQTGLTAGELAAVLPYEETVIQGYL